MTTEPTTEQNHLEEALVERVLDSFEDADNPRLKQIMQNFTKHLHNFVRLARPTEDELNTGIEFLTAVG